MTQPAKSQEPSMEEILASIRRIIADDDANKAGVREIEAVAATLRPVAAPPSPRPTLTVAEAAPAEPSVVPMRPEPVPPMDEPVEAEEQPADILDLTESMAASAPGEPAPAPMPAPTPTPDPAPGMPAQFRRIDGLSDVSFEEVRAPLAPPSEALRQPPVPAASARGDEDREKLLSKETSAAVDSAFNTLAHTVLVQNARTLEDLVREMLRPMLKAWLDDNLPGLVERLVRAEIERVSRGRIG
jgi:cell pole-organizing protein PopZ